MTQRPGVTIDVDRLEVRRSPSGLPTVHITSHETGAEGHFVAKQTLMPGQQVYRHWHPVEETLVFLSGAGIAIVVEQRIAVGPRSALFLPAGVVHGFQNTGTEDMKVLVIFPCPMFAETTFIESEPAAPVIGFDG